MGLRNLAVSILFAVIAMTTGGKASPLDEFHWKNCVLVVVAPAGAPAAETQRRIHEFSARGMSERAIMLTDRGRPAVPGVPGRQGRSHGHFVRQAAVCRLSVRAS